MRGFMEGLLKTLKAENTWLRQRYEPAPEGGPLASVREDRGEGALDEFLALEAEAEEAGEAGEAEGGVSSPLREARMHAWEVVEEAEAEHEAEHEAEEDEAEEEEVHVKADEEFSLL